MTPLNKSQQQWWVYHNKKCHCLNNFSCVLEYQLQLDNGVSCCSQVDLLSAEALHSTLLERLRSLRFWGAGLRFSTQADFIGFLWDSGLEKVQATPFELPQPPAAIPWGCNLNELGHCPPLRWNQAVSACHSTIHRAVLYWLDTPAQTVTPPPPKARLVTAVADA